MKSLTDYIKESARQTAFPVTGDVVECNINEELAIDLGVVEHTDDGVVVEMDALAQYILEHCGCSFEEEVELDEDYKTPDEAKAYQDGKKAVGKGISYDDNPNKKGSKEYTAWSKGHNNARAEMIAKRHAKEEVEVDEAEYQGREVKLGKPMRGDVKKYKVFVKDKKTGNVKKVNFGSKEMEIKRDDPERRKSFRARHGCGTPRASDRTKAAYWSCRMWSSKPVSKILKGK